MRIKGAAATPPSQAHLTPLPLLFLRYAVNQTYLPLNAALGNAGSFYFYAAVAVASGIWIQLFIFETKGRTLEEIQELLKGKRAGNKDTARGDEDEGEGVTLRAH